MEKEESGDMFFAEDAFLLLGHGHSKRRGENTIKEYVKYLAAGACGFETDVRALKGGRLVIMHDARIDRTTTGTGEVAQLTGEEIKRFYVKGGGEIPLLSEALLHPRLRAALVNMELKESGIASGVLDSLQHCGATRRVIVSAYSREENESNPDAQGASSSCWEDLFWLQERSGVRVGLLSEKPEHLERSLEAAAARRGRIFSVHPYIGTLIAGGIENITGRARQLGVKIIPYTVNDPEHIIAVKKHCEGAITDYPGRFKRGK